jgi:hypothetical protein
VNVLLLCWTARFAVLLAAPLRSGLSARLAAAAACLALPITASFAAAWKAPRMAWAAPLVSTEVAPDTRAAAAWLRAHAVPGEVFTIARPDPGQRLYDDATAIVAMSGVPAWIARPAIHRTVGGLSGRVAEERLAILEQVWNAADATQALSRLRDARVDYYVVTGDQGPPWDPGCLNAAHRLPTIAIYAARQR